MDTFTVTYDLMKLNLEPIEKAKQIKSSNDTEALIECPTKKLLGPDGPITELYKSIKEKLTPMILKQLHKVERKHNSKLAVQN
jgi:hypothetical protein